MAAEMVTLITEANGRKCSEVGIGAKDSSRVGKTPEVAGTFWVGPVERHGWSADACSQRKEGLTMQWEFVVALVLAVPIVLFPVAFIWYLNIGGVYAAIRKVRERRATDRQVEAKTRPKPNPLLIEKSDPGP